MKDADPNTPSENGLSDNGNAVDSKADEHGNLYSNPYDDTKILDDRASKIFAEYLEKVGELKANEEKGDTEHANDDRASRMKNLYKEIFFETLKAYGIEVNFELYVAGSLARKQASIYSDIDGFILFHTEEDYQTATPALKGFYYICQRIFKETNVFYPDPVGINPKDTSGTPTQLFDRLTDDSFAEPGIILRSLMSSLPLTGQTGLKKQLLDAIKESEVMSKWLEPQTFYTESIKYEPPAAGAKTIDLKTHILRPVNFILQGLALEYDRYSNQEDGLYLDGNKLIDWLQENKKLSPEEIASLRLAYDGASKLRIELHNVAEAEKNDIELTQDVQKLLDAVAILRAIPERKLAVQKSVLQPESAQNNKSNAWLGKFAFGVLALGGALIGIGVGLLLVSTGVFAPLGAGLIGLSVMGGLGALAGISLSGAIGYWGAKLMDRLFGNAEVQRNSNAKETDPALEPLVGGGSHEKMYEGGLSPDQNTESEPLTSSGGREFSDSEDDEDREADESERLIGSGEDEQPDPKQGSTTFKS